MLTGTWHRETTRQIRQRFDCRQKPRAELTGTEILLDAPFSERLVKACHHARGRWDRVSRKWKFPLTAASMVISAFREKGEDIVADTISRVVESAPAEKARIEAAAARAREALKKIPDMTETLAMALAEGSPPPYPFQRVGVGFAEMHGGQVVIGDEMGLGKTLQAIGFAAIHPEARPAIFVVPNVAVVAWEQALDRWLDEPRARARKGSDEWDQVRNLVIPWSLVAKCQDAIARLNPKLIVADEGHYMKEPTSLRSKAMTRLADLPSVKYRLALTGTPMLNRPRELWPLLQFSQPGRWGTYQEYLERYCDPQLKQVARGRKAFDYNGASNQGELAERLVDVMIRRLKSEVLPDLPEKRRVMVPCEVDLRRADFKPEDVEKLRRAVELQDKGMAMAATGIFRRLCGIAKIEPAVEWAEDFLDTDPDRKLVIFAFHRDVQGEIADRLAKYGVVRLKGMQDADERGKAINDFQTDPAVRVAVCSISAAREAVTLTAAQDLMFAERDWVPGVELQAEDRIHRIGQKGSCTIHRLQSNHPIDQALDRAVRKKQQVADSILAGVEGAGWAEGKLHLAVAEELLALIGEKKCP